MSTLLKLGLSGYEVEPRFCAFECEYLLQNLLFLWGKNFGDTRHLSEKNEPIFDRLGGGCTVRSASSQPNTDFDVLCCLLLNTQ